MRTIVSIVALVSLAGCSGEAGPSSSRPPARPAAAASETARPARPSATTPPPTGIPSTASAGVRASDGRPRPAVLTIAGISLRGLVVTPYRGHTDDAPGTAIQDTGRGASPYGPAGGTGPGGIGNYQVTAHRTSSTAAFARLPELRRGDRVRVSAGGVTYVYRITETRRTSFRSAASLRAQRAAVPGRPGQVATRAMITLSTCATQEDHAMGNYWSDALHNPEHRIDKIGVLVAVR